MEKKNTNNEADSIKLAKEFANMIQNKQDPKNYFKKKKYNAYFEEYCRSKEELFSNIKMYWKQLQEVSEEQELTKEQKKFLNQLAQAIAKTASQEVEPLKGMKKGDRQSEWNLFMVTSVFPCTLKLWPEYGEELCKEMVQEWKRVFPGTELGYADYEKLCAGFRSFWGFFTGR